MHLHPLSRALLLVLVVCAGGGVPAETVAQTIRAAPEQARARGRLIRSALKLHQQLRAAKIPLPLPASEVIKPEIAQAKSYGDSWTCRSSSRYLQRALQSQQLSLKMDSSGQNAFRWGKEGWVSYHYYLVDQVAQPRVLIDPTASTNFAHDIRPDGLLRNLLLETGQARGLSRAADRVAQRIQRRQPDGVLVLANPAEIQVYKEALERAAQLRAEISRNSQLQGR